MVALRGLARRAARARPWAGRPLSSGAPFVVEGADASPERVAALLGAHGVVVVRDFLGGEVLDRVASSLRSATEEVLEACEGVPLGVGSVRGFEEVVLRSPGRYDCPQPFDALDAGAAAFVERYAAAALGSDFERAFCGTVLARPGSPAQAWHADSLHRDGAARPAQLLNVLVALDDVTLDMGPTEVVPGSHQLTNHHVEVEKANPRFDDRIVYQDDAWGPGVVGLGEGDAFRAALPRGAAVLFDDRILHRGGANRSDEDRWVGYLSYLRRGFSADTHFEAYRSLAELRKGAADLAATVRSEFPGLVAVGEGAALVDGASGSQVHDTVLEAVKDAMVTASANLGGRYPSSERVLELVVAARRAYADFLHCDPAEVVFGNNATTLVTRVSRAIARDWEAGDNVVLSALDHDANAGPWAWAAREAGVDVRWIPVTDEGTLDLSALPRLVDDRTRVVACGVASNGLGAVTDVAAVCASAKALAPRALTFLDAVHFAPHGLVDVEAFGCDFLVCSPYKFFGPHCGVLYGRRALLESLGPAKLLLSDDGLPSDGNCHMSKWELGTQNFEALAGATAAVDYLASLGDRFGGLTADPAALSRRERLVAGFAAIATHEHALKRRFLDGAAKIDGLTVVGPADGRARTSTFAVVKEGVDPERLTATLVDDHRVYCTYGNHYCRLWEGLGLDAATGATRLGFLHYNTVEDVDRALAALDAA